MRVNSDGTVSSSRKSYSRLAGSAVAGFAEIICFHPVDTVAKRFFNYLYQKVFLFRLYNKLI